MYSIGDTVIYGTEGICEVTDITVMSFGGDKAEYYILTPISKRQNTIYAPTDNDKIKRRMRPILTSKEARKLIDSLPIEPMEWIENSHERQDVFKNILLCGSPEDVFSMLTALYQKQNEQENIGKKLHASDERFMRDGERMLFSELAFALKTDVNEIVKEVFLNLR
ncbi:MAG: hypothetical protein IJT40_01050 [Firmicutes bacterium]|nr:hypothetical protein [Bacillota bacterium]